MSDDEIATAYEAWLDDHDRDEAEGTFGRRYWNYLERQRGVAFYAGVKWAQKRAVNSVVVLDGYVTLVPVEPA